MVNSVESNGASHEISKLIPFHTEVMLLASGLEISGVLRFLEADHRP